MKERQCRICGEWKDRKENFGKDSAKGRNLWCFPCKAKYSMLQSCIGPKEAKDWIKYSQKGWDFVHKFPPRDRETS